MKYLISLISALILIISCSPPKPNNDNNSVHPPQNNTGSNLMLGMYGLQAPVGSQGFQNGSVIGIEEEILSAYKGGVTDDFAGVTCAIAYRHWDRVRYPDWDYHGFVKNYMSGMYNITKNDSGDAGIQVLTPPLYSSFFVDPVEKMPTNDKGIDRELDTALLTDFVNDLLEHEISTVLTAVGNDTVEAAAIMLDQNARPLGGWYLDDEPLARNHDIEITQSMSKAIREAEEDFYAGKAMFSSILAGNINSLQLRRYIAFDSDDLHNYPGAMRPEEGRHYNLNGQTIFFEDGHIYSVYGEDVYDVLMPDFYHRNVDFWDVILDGIDLDYSASTVKKPQIMPVIRGQVTEWDDIDTQAEFYSNLLTKLLSRDISGIWIYTWRDTNPRTMDVVETWTHPKVQLSKIVKSIK